ncbi:MAG TPA: hypothetical protein HPP87_10990 [Planctomycetes bacterium]|nr:hypothetical protein [Planctomycetota bacterium]
MSDTITLEKYQMFLALAPTNMLKELVVHLLSAVQKYPDNSPESDCVAMMYFMLVKELDMREVEPLWRKAKRFAIRNSSTIKEVGKIAACIGAGVLLGVSLDD